MLGAVSLDIFNLQVGVFRTEKQRLKFLRAKGCEVVKHNDAVYASAHMDVDERGAPFFSLVIKENATRATWAHECVHIADFVMGALGIPAEDNTEIRGYIVGHLFAGIEDMM